jgi:phage-related minor tail protein
MSSELRRLVDAARLEAAKGAVRDVRRLRKIAKSPGENDAVAVSATRATLEVAGATKQVERDEQDGLTAAQLMEGIIAILRLKMPAAVDVLDAEFSEVPRALPDSDPAA